MTCVHPADSVRVINSLIDQPPFGTQVNCKMKMHRQDTSIRQSSRYNWQLQVLAHISVLHNDSLLTPRLLASQLYRASIQAHRSTLR